MSGIDEQSTSIPTCPICEKKPLFWSLYPTTDGSDIEGWMWLFSKEYIEGSGRNRLSCQRCFDLDEVNSICCRPDFVGVYKINRHHFKKGSEIFEVVMRAARRLKK